MLKVFDKRFDLESFPVSSAIQLEVLVSSDFNLKCFSVSSIRNCVSFIRTTRSTEW